MIDEAGAQVDDSPDVDDPEEPDLSDDDLAEIPDDVVEEVAAETTDAEEVPGEGSEPGDAGDDAVPSAEAAAGDEDLTNSVGDLYCNALAVGAAYGRDRRGSLEEDRADAVDHYKDLARDLELDDYMDQWFQQHVGGSGELSPGQGLMAYTSLFAVMVLVDDPELIDGALDELENLDGGEEP